MKSPFHTKRRQNESAGRRACDGVAASSTAGGLDAPPSNRASNKCNAELFQLLSRHIDSLEVSIPGEIGGSTARDVDRLKELARSREDASRALAQVVVAGHVFQVHAKGARMFPFVLSNDCFYIKLSGPGSAHLPLAACQIRNSHLLHLGPREAVADLVRVVSELGTVAGYETVSRVDLAVDFVTNQAMDAWTREAWVTKLQYKQSHSVGEHFTGWSIGRKGSCQFSMYDKTFEIFSQSGKEYLYEIWERAGWVPWDPVWRAEGRFWRPVLAQFGLTTLNDTLGALGGLWRYLTETTIRLTVPNMADETRSRWPNHAVWDALTCVDWETPGNALIRAYKGLSAPRDRTLAIRAISALTSVMGRDGILEAGPAWSRLQQISHSHLKTREIATGRTPEEALIEKAQEKGRRWSTLQNVTAGPVAPPQGLPATRVRWEPGSA